MAKTDPTSTPAADSGTDATPAPLGFAKVQPADGPDLLDANNTGRVGDAREYDAERLAAAAAAPAEGFKVGQVAPETKYADLTGKPVSSADAGEDGFRGTVIVAKGSVVTAAQAAQLQG